MDESPNQLTGALFHMLRSATKTGPDVGADKVARAILRRNRTRAVLASVPEKTLSPDELITLLAKLLTDVVGGHDQDWRKRMTIERVNLTFSPHSNWRVSASGRAKEREAIMKAVEIVQGEHPYVRWE